MGINYHLKVSQSSYQLRCIRNNQKRRYICTYLLKKVRQQSLLEQNEEASKKIAPRDHTILSINLVQSSAQRDQNMSNKPLLEA